MSKKIITIAEQITLPVLQGMDMELVDIEFVKEGANWYLRIFIDKEGGIHIDDCSRVSEVVSKKLDELDPISQAYFLEVSSPGAERPIRTDKDYLRAIGKGVQITTTEPINGAQVFEGTLLSKDDDVILQVGKEEIVIPVAKIEKARLAIIF